MRRPRVLLMIRWVPVIWTETHEKVIWAASTLAKEWRLDCGQDQVQLRMDQTIERHIGPTLVYVYAC